MQSLACHDCGCALCPENAGQVWLKWVGISGSKRHGCDHRLPGKQLAVMDVWRFSAGE